MQSNKHVNPETEKVFVTRISHRHGTDFFVNRTEAGALDNLYGFVAKWWEAEGVSRRHRTDDPDGGDVGPIDAYDKSTAIELYFERWMRKEWEVSEARSEYALFRESLRGSYAK